MMALFMGVVLNGPSQRGLWSLRQVYTSLYFRLFMVEGIGCMWWSVSLVLPSAAWNYSGTEATTDT